MGPDTVLSPLGNIQQEHTVVRVSTMKQYAL